MESEDIQKVSVAFNFALVIAVGFCVEKFSYPKNQHEQALTKRVSVGPVHVGKIYGSFHDIHQGICTCPLVSYILPLPRSTIIFHMSMRVEKLQVNILGE